MVSAKSIALVFFGAGFGAVIRFLLSTWINQKNSSAFPLGTLIVNISGSILIGVAMGVLISKHSNETMKYLFVIGLLGGYTTFSSFSYEVISLFERQLFMSATSYILASNIGCIGCCWLSTMITKLAVSSSS